MKRAGPRDATTPSSSSGSPARKSKLYKRYKKALIITHKDHLPNDPKETPSKKHPRQKDTLDDDNLTTTQHPVYRTRLPGARRPDTKVDTITLSEPPRKNARGNRMVNRDGENYCQICGQHTARNMREDAPGVDKKKIGSSPAGK